MLRPEFLLVFTVYFLTYLAANVASTTCEAAEIDGAMHKLTATTIVNVVSCISKDAMLARLYSGGPARAVPIITLLLFTSRDFLTMLSSFTIPGKVSKKLQTKRWGSLPPVVADNASQLFCPCLVQVVSTPIHLLGLSHYNAPAASIGERVAMIKGNYVGAVGGRIGRILPAFGLGGCGNTILREKFQDFARRGAKRRRERTEGKAK